VKDGQLIGLLRRQMACKNIGKKMVIAVPVSPVIQRNQEKVTSLQGFQLALPPG
jgi:hypothetical protein